MKYYTILILTSLFFAFGELKAQISSANSSSVDNYINNPRESDSLCIKELARAKKDEAKGKIVFCSPMGFGAMQLRYQNELEELCRQHNLIFEYELFSDVIIDGQTQGCYGSYMNNIISKRFGKNFKKNLEEQADSILIAHAVNDTIEYWNCDVRPHLPGQKEEYESTIVIPTSKELKSKLIAGKDGHYPFMDIDFIIEVSGQTSGYYCQYFYDADNSSNKNYFDQMWNEAMKELKKYPIWETGQLNGHKVRTRHNVRVYF